MVVNQELPVVRDNRITWKGPWRSSNPTPCSSQQESLYHFRQTVVQSLLKNQICAEILSQRENLMSFCSHIQTMQGARDFLKRAIPGLEMESCNEMMDGWKRLNGRWASEDMTKHMIRMVHATSLPQRISHNLNHGVQIYGCIHYPFKCFWQIAIFNMTEGKHY